MASLDLTLGALEVGVLLSSVLYGISTVQVYLYTERGFSDSLWIRITVALVWIFETIHTLFIWILLYTLTVTHYGQHETINDSTWSLSSALPFTSLIGSSVQAFFAYRVLVLSGRWFIPVIAWAGAILRTAIGITLGVLCLNAGHLTTFFARYQWLVTTQLVLDAAIDILNTSALCFYLSRRRFGFKSTRTLVDKLLRYTIETGLLTSVCAAAILASSLIMPDNLVVFGLLVFYPKLFSNSLLTSLNARQTLRQTATPQTPDRTRVMNSIALTQHTISSNNGFNTVDLELSPTEQNSSFAHPASLKATSIKAAPIPRAF